MRESLTPFGLIFAEPRQGQGMTAMTSSRRRPTVGFDGRPLCELLATDMADSQPTEKDGKDPINVDSDPFYD